MENTMGSSKRVLHFVSSASLRPHQTLPTRSFDDIVEAFECLPSGGYRARAAVEDEHDILPAFMVRDAGNPRELRFD
jgi:hypothetical protein